MADKKLGTIQQLASYIGCECIVGNRVGILAEIDIYRDPTVIFKNTHTIPTRSFVPIEDVKLVLNLISSISEEYLVILFDKTFTKSTPLTDNGKSQVMSYWLDHNMEITYYEMCERFWSTCDFSDTVKIINQLRKDGYDCDDLIEQGLAINKAKI